MAFVWSVVSAKGGTGKSSITAALGAALSRNGNQVLLIDMDEGLGCLPFLLGVADQIVYDWHDFLNGSCNALDAALAVPDCPGLYVLPAPRDCGAITQQTANKLCSQLSSVFDFILIDCPSGINVNVFHAASGSDNLLIITTPDPSSIRAAAVLKTKLQNKNCRLVINKAETNFMLQFLNIDEMIDASGIQLIAVIPNDSLIRISGAKGVLVSAGPAAEAVNRLAGRLLNKNIPLTNKKFS